MRLPLWILRWLHRQDFSRKRLRGGRLHGWFGDRILAKDLWLPARGSLARAWLIGFPITMVPFLPAQSVFATFGALFVRGNLLLCVGLQFMSNPLTAPVQLPLSYFVGEVVRGRMPDSTWRSVTEDARHLLTGDAVISLYLGAIVVGLLGGVIGYAVILGTWRDRHHRPRGTPPPFAAGKKQPPAP